MSAFDESSSAAAPELPRPRDARGATAGDLAQRLGAQLRAPSGGATGSRVAERARLTGVTLDSRAVQPGDLWCALPGARAHGAEFAAQAAQLGALAALTDEAGAQRCADAGLIVLVAADPREATAPAAAIVYGEPAKRLQTIGVTGTNGKTSITMMVQEALLSFGRPAGVIGTSGTAYRDASGIDHQIATVRTTPEAPELHGILARMADDGVQVCAMEISSHALVLHRADDVVCTVACFTNLTQDHLDFHGSMEEYFAAKARLFTPAHASSGIVCVDDEWGRRLAAEASIPVTTYATRPGLAADVIATDVAAEGFGSVFTARTAQREQRLRAPLPGRHYVANTVGAWLLLRAVGVDPESAARGLATAVVPGRLEQVAEHPVRGVVDYSHTADAIEQALVTLRAVPGTRCIIAVIGAGGDRDRTKRPIMGATAAAGADVVIVTDDNPRTEDPAAIRADVAAGIPTDSSAEVHVVDGRGRAIELAARLAGVGDTILVAGKGAETGQDIGGIVHPFDDRVRLRAALADRESNASQTRDGEHRAC